MLSIQKSSQYKINTMHNLSLSDKGQSHQQSHSQSNPKQSLWHISRKSHNSSHSESKWLNTSLHRRHSNASRQLPELQTKTIDLMQPNRANDNNIYFSKTKKYNYMKQIIDKYFDQSKYGSLGHGSRSNPQENHKAFHSIIPRITQGQRAAREKGKEDNKSGKRRIFMHRRVVDQKEDEGLGDLTQSKNMTMDTIEEDSIDITRSLSFSQKNSSLPPIDELYEGLDEQNNRYDSISYLNQSLYLNDSHQQNPSQRKLRVSQNDAYVVDLVFSGNRPTHHLKTYLEKGLPLLTREKKATALGVQSAWIEYKYDQNGLIRGPNLSIKELLFKAKRVDADCKFYTLKTKKYHKKLTTNRCQQLKRVLRQFCQTMQTFQGRIVNNKINTGNIFMAKNDNWKLGEWGLSSFRETHVIQGHQFQNRMDPILKSQKEWFVPPQYMAPEIIRAISFGEESDLMALGAAPDIWSIGVLIFQILTIIPVWITQKCTIHQTQMQPRSGILAVSSRDLKKMLKRQQKLAYLMSKTIQQQCSHQDYPIELLQVMYRCVQYDPKSRPSYQDIIDYLK